MSKFSARKPVTVFVAVIIVIVLGVISVINMTPDLLPNMDLPYVVVMTTYTGATPQKVEQTVTKPVEQSLASLEHLKSIQSTSAANYSMVILEFDTNVNMDTISVDILGQIDQVSGYWEDTVGNPYVLKINPSMLPVMITAVDREGYDTFALSEFVENTLLQELEGTVGVASISTSGLLEESVSIELDDEKIEAVNEQVALVIEEELAEAKADLEDAQGKIDSGRAELKKGKQQLESQQNATGDELANASKMIDEAVAQSAAYQANLSGLNASKAALTSEKTMYENGLVDMKAALAVTETGISQLTARKAAIAPIVALSLPEETALSSILTPEQLALIAGQNCNTLGDVKKLDQSLAEQVSAMTAQKGTLQVQIDAANSRVSQIDAELANLATEIIAMQTAVDQIDEMVSQAKDNYTAVEKGIFAAAIGFGAGSAQITSAESALDEAQQDLDEGLKQYEEAVEEALESANLEDTITMDTVSALLAAQNFSMPAGYVYEGETSFLVSVGDGVETLASLEDLVLFDLGMEGLEPIRVSDVANVSVTDNADSVYAMINGKPGVALTFTKQSTYSTAGVSDNVLEKFEELSEKYPGLTFTTLMNQGEYIYMLTGSIVESLLWGALFAVIVLFLFLWDIRPTFITLLSIPISVMLAIAMMYFTGVTINIMSLSGLAIAVGMLVDNSVVVIENIYRLRALGEPPVKAAVSGAAQVGGAIIASTLTTICVFVPIVFVEGLTRQLFVDFALTMGYALIASLLIAMSLVPALSATMLGKIRAKSDQATIFDKIKRSYGRSVAWSLRHKALVLAVAVVLLFSSMFLALSKGFSFFPDTFSAQINVSMEVPEGTDFQQTVEMANVVMDEVLPIEGIADVGAILSNDETGLMGSSSQNAAISLYVMLEEGAERDSKQIGKEIEARTQDLPCTVTVAEGSTMTSYSSMLGGSGVGINVYGNDLDALQEGANLLAEALKEVEGVQDVDDGLEDAEPEIHFVVDKDAAMKEGLTVAQVYQEISAALTGQKAAGTLTIDAREYDTLILHGAKEEFDRAYIETYAFTVTDKDGEKREVSLKDIAKIEEKQTPSTIQRSDQRQYLSVSATIAEGYNVTHVTDTAKQTMQNLAMPAGISYEFAGENETIMDSMKDLALMLGIGILLVYLIMAAQFQSWKSPFIVIFTIPLAFTGGFLALLLCGMDVSIISMIGFVMLCGIIVNNGIVLVDYINRLRADGIEKHAAIVEACLTRIRPILMTSITTILGLIVMAMGLSEGSAIMRPMAVVCIGGLIYATFMTLYVVPAIYDMMNKKALRVVKEEDLIISKK